MSFINSVSAWLHGDNGRFLLVMALVFIPLIIGGWLIDKRQRAAERARLSQMPKSAPKPREFYRKDVRLIQVLSLLIQKLDRLSVIDDAKIEYYPVGQRTDMLAAAVQLRDYKSQVTGRLASAFIGSNLEPMWGTLPFRMTVDWFTSRDQFSGQGELIVDGRRGTYFKFSLQPRAHNYDPNQLVVEFVDALESPTSSARSASEA